MKRSKLVVMMMLLSLALASFVSVPALSNENPWDADNPGSGTTADSSATGIGDDAPDNNTGVTNPMYGVPDIQTWLIQAYIALYQYATGHSTINSQSDSDKGQSSTVSRK